MFSDRARTKTSFSWLTWCLKECRRARILYLVSTWTTVSFTASPDMLACTAGWSDWVVSRRSSSSSLGWSSKNTCVWSWLRLKEEDELLLLPNLLLGGGSEHELWRLLVVWALSEVALAEPAARPSTVEVILFVSWFFLRLSYPSSCWIKFKLLKCIKILWIQDGSSIFTWVVERWTKSARNCWGKSLK